MAYRFPDCGPEHSPSTSSPFSSVPARGHVLQFLNSVPDCPIHTQAGDVKSAAVSKAREMADKRRGAHQGGATIEFFDEAEEEDDRGQQGRRISG